MNTAITVIQILLIVLFTGAGLMKLIHPYDKYTKLPFQVWANDFKPQHIRLIGIVEMIAAISMIMTLFLSSLATLVPLIAVGMALVMAGAMSVHLRRSEYLNMIGNAMWIALALFIAYNELVGTAI